MKFLLKNSDECFFFNDISHHYRFTVFEKLLMNSKYYVMYFESEINSSSDLFSLIPFPGYLTSYQVRICHKVILKWRAMLRSKPMWGLTKKCLVSSTFPNLGASDVQPWIQLGNADTAWGDSPMRPSGCEETLYTTHRGLPVRMAYCVCLKAEPEAHKMSLMTPDNVSDCW